MKLNIDIPRFEGVDKNAQNYVRKTITTAMEEMAAQAFDDWSCAVSLCESPIEEILLSRLMFLDSGYFGGFGETKIWDTSMPLGKPRGRVVVAPQFVVGSYRLDFAVFCKNFNDDEIRLGIECDGHDFHERTKEQARRDKKRDRDLQLDGWRIFRFTGSEVYRDPDACVDEITSFLSNWVEDDLRARGVLPERKAA